MKKVLIVINNFEVGGVQKSLLGYLKSISHQCEVTVVALSEQGPLLEWVPEDVRLLETKSLYRYFGMAQRDCRGVKDKLLRAAMAIAARYLGAGFVQRFADPTVDDLGEFDEIVSFHHPGRQQTIYGGTAEYVLAYARRHPAQTVCYVHCDYSRSNLCDSRSKRLFTEFAAIICVSDGTRKSFIDAFRDEPEQTRRMIERKTLVRYNTVDSEMILRQAEEGGIPDCMEKRDPRLILLSVARISQEKGILRFAKILSEMDCSAMRYVIVGDGSDVGQLKKLIAEKHLEDTIFLAGEKTNPYPYMKYADILVVPSYHEGAPMVFQEAAVLGLPVFTTDTLSAREMVKNGWVADNNDAAICKMLREVIDQWSR